MHASTPHLVCTKIVGIGLTKPPPAGSKVQPPSIKSILTLCGKTSQAISTLNAVELTNFRTSPGSILAFRFRRNIENIFVFIARKQTLEYVRLTVLLRRKDT